MKETVNSSRKAGTKTADEYQACKRRNRAEKNWGRKTDLTCLGGKKIQFGEAQRGAPGAKQVDRPGGAVEHLVWEGD